MEALTKQTYEQYVLDEKQTCLVLYIKDGCPICQELHPLIEEIAEGLGYDNVTHFIRQFKKEVGLSPSSFRKK